MGCELEGRSVAAQACDGPHDKRVMGLMPGAASPCLNIFDVVDQALHGPSDDR